MQIFRKQHVWHGSKLVMHNNLNFHCSWCFTAMTKMTKLNAHRSTTDSLKWAWRHVSTIRKTAFIFLGMLKTAEQIFISLRNLHKAIKSRVREMTKLPNGWKEKCARYVKPLIKPVILLSFADKSNAFCVRWNESEHFMLQPIWLMCMSASCQNSMKDSALFAM